MGGRLAYDWEPSEDYIMEIMSPPDGVMLGGQLLYSPEDGEGAMVFSEMLDTLPDVTQLDILKDAIGDLTEEYNRRRELCFGGVA